LARNLPNISERDLEQARLYDELDSLRCAYWARRIDLFRKAVEAAPGGLKLLVGSAVGLIVSLISIAAHVIA
jgi:hypothetical protein